MAKIVKDFIAVENDNGGLGIVIGTKVRSTWTTIPLLAQSLNIPYSNINNIITITLGGIVAHCCFDGTYIWVGTQEAGLLSKRHKNSN